jgi:Predicted metal-binding protein
MNINEHEIITKSIEFGAFKSGFTDVADVVFEPELRKACEANYCGNYGRNHTCPPKIGTAEELIARAKSYNRIFVFQTVTPLEDSFDFEGMTDARIHHSEIASKIEELFDIPHLQLTAGGCTFCERCAGYEGQPCRHPDKAVASLEAYCINVAKLAGKCGMKYINGQDTVTYFAGFLF